jgi:hypothetical protein
MLSVVKLLLLLLLLLLICSVTLIQINITHTHTHTHTPFKQPPSEKKHYFFPWSFFFFFFFFFSLTLPHTQSAVRGACVAGADVCIIDDVTMLPTYNASGPTLVMGHKNITVQSLTQRYRPQSKLFQVSLLCVSLALMRR